MGVMGCTGTNHSQISDLSYECLAIFSNIPDPDYLKGEDFIKILQATSGILRNLHEIRSELFDFRERKFKKHPKHFEAVQVFIGRIKDNTRSLINDCEGLDAICKDVTAICRQEEGEEEGEEFLSAHPCFLSVVREIHLLVAIKEFENNFCYFSPKAVTAAEEELSDEIQASIQGMGFQQNLCSIALIPYSYPKYSARVLDVFAKHAPLNPEYHLTLCSYIHEVALQATELAEVFLELSSSRRKRCKV